MHAKEEQETAVSQNRSAAAGFGSHEIRGPEQPQFPHSRRNYKFAMEQFITWYCSEPRLEVTTPKVKNRTLTFRGLADSLICPKFGLLSEETCVLSSMIAPTILHSLTFLAQYVKRFFPRKSATETARRGGKRL